MDEFSRLSRAMTIGSAAGAMLIAAANVQAAESNIAEIVVTAQKRSENLQDVPASVSAVGEQSLARLHVTQLNDVAAYLPGINVTGGGSPGQTSITLRGIAPLGPGSVVGTYIDETPLGGSSNYARATEFGLDLMPYDVERIEVLRGPQGTLYGAGAMGGLLKYVMRDPSTEALEFRAGVEGFDVAGARDAGWGARAGVNVPLGSAFAMRASYFDQYTPGYIDNVFTGEKDENEVNQTGGRASFLWQPGDDLSISFGGTWQRVDSDNNATVVFALTGIDPIRAERNLGDLETSHPLPQRFQKDVDYYSATIDWNLGWGDLVSASSYSKTRTVQHQDATDIFGTLYPLLTEGAIPAGLNEFTLTLDLEKWTQEFRLSSSIGERVDWRVGAFYTEEDSDNVQEVFAFDADRQPIEAFAPYFAYVALPTDYKELAAFGDVTFKFSERFDVNAGLRWAKNDQNFRQISTGAIVPTTETPGDSSENVWTYSLSPRWHLNADTMAYVRVASGYRPGGPNVILPGVPPSVDADKLTNYEAGIKTEFAEGKALINVAAFYVDWQAIQQIQPFGGTSALDNAGDAKTRGLEIESLFAPTPSLQLGANLSYTEAELKSNPPELDNKVGEQLPGVPKWTACLTAAYSFQAFGGRDAHIGVGWRYVDERQTAVVTNAADISYILPQYDIVDLNAEITFDAVTARLFVKNLTDERAYVGGGVIVDGLNQPVRLDANVMQPRTVGLSLDVRF